MRHKVADLEGANLDAAVALAEGYTPEIEDGEVWLYPSQSTAMPPSFDPNDTRPGHRVICQRFHPSREWHEGGPIIERERITIAAVPAGEGALEWMAALNYHGPGPERTRAFSPLPLVAAMRAYVASRFGEEIEL